MPSVSPIPSARLTRVARGEELADLALRDARIVNVLSGEIYPGDVLIAEGRVAAVVAVGEGDGAREERDLGGRYLAPGLIDGHMHLESTMMTLGQFARAVVPRGTTTVLLDPHEFANVLGLAGIRYVLDAARDVPLNAYVMLSSCVPASPLESPRGPLLADDLLPLLDHPGVLGLAEVMDVPGVLRGDPEVLSKVAAARGRGLAVDGHAPGVHGRDLAAYAAAGIGSDHESTTVEEARAKLRLGLWLMVRDGTTTRNLDTLLPLLAELRPPRALFVTDDRDPVDLLARGHVDAMARRALDYGLDPIDVLRLASYNAAQYFGLRDLGAIAPGYRADLLVLGDLHSFTVDAVYKDGQLVAEHGKPLFDAPTTEPGKLEGMTGTIHAAPVTAADLRIPGRTGPALVVGVEVDQVTTRRLVEGVAARDLGHGDEIVADPARDLLKLVVVERHNRTGRVGLGLVKGFGLRRGAIASSVAHDAHNLVVAGASDGDILAAIEALRALGGGFALVADGAALATLALPIAGLVSPLPVGELAAQLEDLDRAAATLGCALEHPFMTLSFLSLSVIPDLKLTDRGLVDVAAARVVPLQGR